jgi:UDP-3-O-[3-hydroxymyristoyl] glucosamine N-acyltransferase
MSFVTKSILKKGIYSGGSMLMEHKSWLKYSAELNRKTKK